MKAAWSCVLDDTPALWASAEPWIRSAIRLAGIDPSCLFIHHAAPLPEGVKTLCEKAGVNTCPVVPFDPQHPTNNKIQQCATDFGDCDVVILTDADMVFVDRPPLEELSHPICGKLVDHPNPPLEVLRDIFQAAQLPEPEIRTPNYWNATGQGFEFHTFSGNLNGGFYAVQRSYLPSLGTAWGTCARWLIERVELVQTWTHHIDQIAFCMALQELGLSVGELDDAWNFPLQLGTAPNGRTPFILHHHLNFHEGFHLNSRVAAPRAQQAMKRVTRTLHPRSSVRHPISFLRRLLAQDR